jgi:hypothetical protein
MSAMLLMMTAMELPPLVLAQHAMAKRLRHLEGRWARGWSGCGVSKKVGSTLNQIPICVATMNFRGRSVSSIHHLTRRQGTL